MNQLRARRLGLVGVTMWVTLWWVPAIYSPIKKMSTAADNRSCIMFARPCPCGELQSSQYLLEGQCSRTQAIQEVSDVALMVTS